MRVLLGSRDWAKGEAAALELARNGFDVEAVRLDVTDAASIGALGDRLGAVDVLINNAGIDYDTDQTAIGADLARVREAFETNLFGAWAMAQAVAPGMRRRRWGRIVNVSSGAGELTSMGRGPPGYSVSKAALNALTRLLAGELAGTGVLVNSVCPGWVSTDMGGSGGRPVRDGAASVSGRRCCPTTVPPAASSATGGRSPGERLAQPKGDAHPRTSVFSRRLPKPRVPRVKVQIFRLVSKDGVRGGGFLKGLSLSQNTCKLKNRGVGLGLNPLDLCEAIGLPGVP